MGFESCFLVLWRLIRVGERGERTEAPLCRQWWTLPKALGGGVSGRPGSQVRVEDALPVYASKDTLVLSAVEWSQDVSKYFPCSCCICQASSLSITIIEPPQVGQVQAVSGAHDLPAPEDLAVVAWLLANS